MGETDALASFIEDASFDDLSELAVDRSKRAILDVTGIALAGSTHPVGERVGQYVDDTMPGAAASVFGRGTASAEGAALANGTAAHALDFDDAFETIRIHPSVAVFPAALAAAEHAGADGRALLAGYALGVETAYRIGHSTYPSHYEDGFHSTGTMGTFGAAAAAAAVMDLPAHEVRRALGVAASSSSALKRNFGSMTKPLHAGHAAGAGVRAALLAGAGLTAASAVLEGEEGYGAVMASDYDPEAITDGLGESWAVTEIGYKLYPSRRNTHGMMEALRRLLNRESLDPEDIARVSVTLDENASMVPNYRMPDGEMEARYSIEFCAAAVLREREPGLEAFADAYVTSPETRAAIETVDAGFDDLVGEGFSGWGARVVVETVDGRALLEEERGTVGHAERIVFDRLREKFAACAGKVLSRPAIEAVESAVSSLEESGSLARLSASLRSEG